MFLFAQVFGLFYYYFAVFRKVCFLESTILLIFGMLVRNKSKNCQNLVTI